MPSQKLIDIKPGKGLDAGLYPSAEPMSGQIWNTGNNVWFRELAIEASLGRSKILPMIGRSSKFIANAFTSFGQKRLYFEDLGIVYFWPGSGAAQLVGSLDPNGSYWLEPWGDFLLATDNINPLQYWTNSGTFFPIVDAQNRFKKCSIVKKLAQMVIAYNTDVLPTGFHWCSINDPLTWTPALTNSARDLSIRNTDSPIIAVADLGVGHAVYFNDFMIIVRYVGPTQWFDTPNQAIQGIGAVSKYSVVSYGNFNFGICRDGVFVTDGSTATFVDRPVFDKFIQENIDWSLASSIGGYWDSKLGLVVWTVPLVGGGNTSIAIDPKLRTVTSESIYLSRKTFTLLDGGINASLERGVFDYPIVSRNNGIYYNSIQATTAGSFNLTSHLFDGGNAEVYKTWDYAVFSGRFGSDAQVRFGVTDQTDASTIQWGPYTQLQNRVPFPQGPRESVYLALSFLGGASTFKLSGIEVYGEPAGNIN